jgi:hypothetical protein
MSIAHLVRPQETDDWVHRMFRTERTLTGWLREIRTLRTPLFPINPALFPHVPSKEIVTRRGQRIPCPWSGRAMAADMLESWLFRNQRVRWIWKAWFNGIRRRIMERRLHGMVDVGTCEAVPVKQAVLVYDWPTRSVYQFHTNTIQQSIRTSLLFQSFGISSPRPPKNPYTNIPWTFAQLLVILEQIQHNMWLSRRRFMNPVLIQYWRSELCLDTFKREYASSLDIECAVAFFGDVGSDERALIFEETLEDLFLILNKTRKSDLFEYIVTRTIPKWLMTMWDDIVLGFWMYRNHARVQIPSISYVRTLQELIDYTIMVIEETMKWIERERPAVMRKRVAWTNTYGLVLPVLTPQ